ncbi:MAG: PfkB family carbohydrate kinase [Gemmobacter sp.]|nr:PfkB family carbohydrate kinase [Gemmobacter sp.]
MDDAGRTAEVMAEARRRGVITTLDVFASTAADLPKVAALLPHTDYFLPSEEEARALSGLTENRDLAWFLLDQGAGCVVLTLGADGAYYHSADGTTFHTPAFQVDVKCTCGCGDCFNGGFATGLLKGLSPQQAVELGQAASAQNATGLGSQAGVKDYPTTLDFIRATPRRGSASDPPPHAPRMAHHSAEDRSLPVDSTHHPHAPRLIPRCVMRWAGLRVMSYCGGAAKRWPKPCRFPPCPARPPVWRAPCCAGAARW